MQNRVNPLLAPFVTDRKVPCFDKIVSSDFSEAFKVALDRAYTEVNAIIECSEEPSFENTIEPLEYAGELLDTVTTIFFNLNSACT